MSSRKFGKRPAPEPRKVEAANPNPPREEEEPQPADESQVSPTADLINAEGESEPAIGAATSPAFGAAVAIASQTPPMPIASTEQRPQMPTAATHPKDETPLHATSPVDLPIPANLQEPIVPAGPDAILDPDAAGATLSQSSLVCGRPGRPPQFAKNVGPVDPKSDPPAPATDESLSVIDEVPENPSFPAFPIAPAMVAALMGIVGLLGLYVYSQAMLTIATLATLPQWLMLPCVVILALLVALVLLALGRLLSGYVRLRTHRQVNLEALLKRDELQKIAQSRAKQARDELENYLQAYPFPSTKNNGGGHRTAFPQDHRGKASEVARFFTMEQLRALQDSRDRLLNNNYRDRGKWFGEFSTTFQATLDEVARKRVHDCAKLVGWKTAIAPYAIVDMLIASYWSFVLMRDLCQIYNLRVNFIGTLTVLWQIFFNVFLAGKIDDLEAHADEALQDAGEDLMPILGAQLVAKLGAKAATGMANYMLVSRLGKRAIRRLQPMSC